MSRKKKTTQDKVKAVDSEVVAEIAPKKTPSPRKEARVRVDTREKAAEVIQPVRVALLETYPSLPDGDAILTAFAEHYRGAEERRAEARVRAEEAARAAAAAAAAAEKKPTSRRSTRPSSGWSMPAAPAASVSEAPRVVDVAPAVQAPPAAPELPPLAVAAEPEPPMMELQPEPSAVFADDAPLFGDDDGPPAEDIFAQLGKSDAPKDNDEFGFAGQSEYSDPFIALSRPAPVMNELGTAEIEAVPAEPDVELEPEALPAFEDVVAVVAEEAAPTDRTTMIQAMPDDEPEADAGDEAGADAPSEEAKPGRKSRKSSTRRKR